MKKLLSGLLAALTVATVLFAAMPAAIAENNNTSEDKAIEKVYGDKALPLDLPFTDVGVTSWYFEAVNYVYSKKIVSGTTETTFAPNMALSRAMCVALLARTEGDDISGYQNKFSDVVPGSWYEKSVAWAAEKGIVAGIGGGKFAPNDPITREQLAVIFHKYTEYIGGDTSPRADLSSFPDASSISSWALDAVRWAVAVGIVSGTGNGIAPKAGADRAQMASILYRFIQKFKMTFAGDIELSRAFSDNMIIQRGEKITVWGNVTKAEFDKNGAGEGKCVKADLGGKAAGIGTVDADGYFEIVLDRTLPASDTPLTLTVTSDTTTIKLDGILIGDVYMIIGQSNVYYSTNHYLVTNPTAVRAEAWDKYFTDMERYDNIRLFRNSSEDYKFYENEEVFGGEYLKANGDPSQTGNECVIQNRGWQRPRDAAKDYDSSYYHYRDTGIAPGSAAEIFSANGYYTACELYAATGVPTGMIEIDASGYSVAAFMPNSLIAGNDHIGSTAHGYSGVYVDDVTQMGSRFAYNQQIHPIRKFSIAGLIWYQGESDAYNTEAARGNEEYTFSKRLTDLINYFRENFGNSDFKTYICEYPMCHSSNPVFYLDFGVARAELNTVKNNLGNAFICASSDFNTTKEEFDSPHSYTKPKFARRLSGIILSSMYGMSRYYDTCFGPTVKSVSYEGNSVTLTYDNVGAGLAFEGGKYAGGYFLLYAGDYNGGKNIVGQNRSYYPNNFVEIKDASKVEIIGKDKVRITGSEKVLGAAYYIITETCYPESVNLRNSGGVPAVSFIDMTNAYNPEDYENNRCFRQIRKYIADVNAGFDVGADYEYALAYVHAYICKRNEGSGITPFSVSETEALAKEYIYDFIDLLEGAEQITAEKAAELRLNYAVSAHEQSEYATLTDSERALPGAVPSIILDIKAKKATLEGGSAVPKADCERDMQRLYFAFKTCIDTLGNELTKEEVEAVRREYMVDFVLKMRSVKAMKLDSVDGELLNNKYRKLMYTISVYEGEEDWPGKDDGWTKPKPAPIDPIIDEDEEDGEG